MNTTNATLATAFVWLVAAMAVPQFFGFSVFMSLLMLVVYVISKHLDLKENWK